MQTTEGWLLDGRVPYAQPAEGYRTGIEPVLLAASVPAQPGQRVLEAGTGAGAGLLCLAARVPGVLGVGLEIDPAMAELARRNIQANGHANGAEGLSVVTADLDGWAGDGSFDHAFSNPPWHDPADTPSPRARQRLATHEGALTLEGWIGALARPLRSGGSLTLILAAARTGRAVAGLRSLGLGGLTLVPLWPKPGRDAKLLIIQGWRGRRGADRLAPGLVLHRMDGGFEDGVQSILRAGSRLVF